MRGSACANLWTVRTPAVSIGQVQSCMRAPERLRGRLPSRSLRFPQELHPEAPGRTHPRLQSSRDTLADQSPRLYLVDAHFSAHCLDVERRSILITAKQPFSGWYNVFPDPGMTVAAIGRRTSGGKGGPPAARRSPIDRVPLRARFLRNPVTSAVKQSRGSPSPRSSPTGRRP